MCQQQWIRIGDGSKIMPINIHQPKVAQSKSEQYPGLTHFLLLHAGPSLRHTHTHVSLRYDTASCPVSMNH